jgi:lysophospholipid acyltransferase (LPLAT)-like uncharacterized protein
MIKKRFKIFLKNSSMVHNLTVNILFLYLKIVYLTNRWEYVWPSGWDEERINKLDGALFAMWHNRLTFCMHIFRNINNTYGLASPHTDGKLITDIIRKMKFGVIEGSTNRNATGSLKEIISKINSGNKVVITPDGPRGPVYKINSSMTRLANKFNKPLIPISCKASKYFELKSWDKMIIPKFFGKITVYIGTPIKLTGDENDDNSILEQTLMQLSDK